MYPIELLTENDKTTINEYLKARGFFLTSLDNVLSNWNKSKKTLLKAFGNQLRFSYPIETKVRSGYLKQQLMTFYSYPKNLFHVFYSESFSNRDIRAMITKNPKKFVEDWKLKNDFIIDTFYFFTTNSDMDLDNYKNFLQLLDYDGVYSNYYLKNYPLIFSNPNRDKDLVIKSGIKIMRAIRKVLDYFNYKRINLFIKWRDDISIIRTTSKTSANLVFSIHPIDFMTLSDNNSNWTSCLGWTNKGCYSNGTLELLNSNMAIVCYIENPNTKYQIENTEYTIPNKMWRAIGYVHKKILLIGKNYPFYDEDISNQALSFLEKNLKKTLHWTYQYKHQDYNDMIYFENDLDITHGSMDDIRYLIDRYDKALYGKHIFLGGNNIYNDVVMDAGSRYICSRNWVKRNLFLNISGKCSCLICGQEIDESGSEKVCYECQEKYTCYSCHKIDTAQDHYRVKILNSIYPWTTEISSDSFPDWVYYQRVFCEECLQEIINSKKLILFRDEENHEILTVNINVSIKDILNYKWISAKKYNEKYYPTFYLWYYQQYVIKDSLPENPSDIFLQEMEQFFKNKIYPINMQTIKKSNPYWAERYKC